jgi:hypothetical protein
MTFKIKFKQKNDEYISIIAVVDSEKEFEKKYVCPKCKLTLSEEHMGKECPQCGEWQYAHTSLKDVPKIIEKEIGHIFTPSGSARDNLNAIQICGFDEAFDLWGCGVFGNKETNNMQKDIQLCWFYPYEQMSDDQIRDVVIQEKEHIITEEQMKRLGLKKPCFTEKIRKSRFSFDLKDGICGKCFNHPCTCEVHINHENPYTVKREQDLYLYKKKDKKENTLG